MSYAIRETARIMCPYSYSHFGTNLMQLIIMKCCGAVTNVKCCGAVPNVKCCGAVSNEISLKENMEYCLKEKSEKPL